MKLDRRSFLSLGAGAAAGTALSPLPWKLVDDSSIWTQNWPWTPVPVDGETTYADSVCTLCPGKCGISVRMVAGRPVKIEGKEGFPVNDGGICPLGAAGLQFLYGPSRIKSPMKKEGGAWKKISWDEGIAILAAKLTELRDGGASDKAAVISGSASPAVSGLFKRFMKVYGSPNFITEASLADSYSLMFEKAFGKKATACFDLENADFILSFGAGVLDGWGAPVRMISAHSKWKDAKTTLVQVEPRLSNTAAKADQWVAAKPGTEAALALGIAAAMLKKGLYSKNFANEYTEGFDAWSKAVVEGFAPEKAAEITGVPAATIEALAKAFAGAKKPLAIAGRGKGQTPVTVGEAMAVNALNVLAGNINGEGGLLAVTEPAYVTLPEVELDDVATAAADKKRLDGGEGATGLVHRLAAADAGTVQLLMVEGANPVYTLKDTAAVKKAFEKIPMVVSFSPYMDETAAASDLILPGHVYLEKTEDVVMTSAVNKPAVGLTRPVVAPMFDTRSTGDAIILLAQAMESVSGAFPWEDGFEACLEELYGDRWETLGEAGYWADEEFKPGDAAKFTLPTEGALFDPVVLEGDAGAFPLVLVPSDSIRMAAGSIGEPAFAMKTVSDMVLKENDTLVEINPATAKKLGLSEGKKVTLTTPRGKVAVRAHLYEGIMPGVVAMPTGFGHTAYDDYLSGKGASYNALVGPVEDPDSGLDVAMGIRAKLG